jgi:hypothetical protein
MTHSFHLTSTWVEDAVLLANSVTQSINDLQQIVLETNQKTYRLKYGCNQTPTPSPKSEHPC